jgi:FkbM family methyltransferase
MFKNHLLVFTIYFKRGVETVRLINWIMRKIDLMKFRVKYPDVPIVKPQSMGTFYSQDGQDVYLSSLLFNWIKDDEGGYVIDVGCNHPVRFSNSFFFDKYFNCKTIAIDPIEEYGNLWRSLRPNAIFIASALGKVAGVVTLNIPDPTSIYDDMFSSINLKNPKVGETGCTQREVPCATLASVLENYNVTNILFVSIDVEGFELDVLEGIDFEHVSIKCFVIENNTDNLLGAEEIRIFLKSKGYVYISRIGFLDDIFLHNSLLIQ